MVGDPIADMITRIRNAAMVGKPSTYVPYSRLKFEVAELLKREGYLLAVNKRGKRVRKFLEVDIAYDDNKQPRLQGIKRVSRPSQRVYKGADKLFPFRQGRGRFVLTTPKGVMTGSEARKAKTGGEVLFAIW